MPLLSRHCAAPLLLNMDQSLEYHAFSPLSPRTLRCSLRGLRGRTFLSSSHLCALVARAKLICYILRRFRACTPSRGSQPEWFAPSDNAPGLPWASCYFSGLLYMAPASSRRRFRTMWTLLTLTLAAKSSSATTGSRYTKTIFAIWKRRRFPIGARPSPSRFSACIPGAHACHCTSACFSWLFSFIFSDADSSRRNPASGRRWSSWRPQGRISSRAL